MKDWEIAKVNHLYKQVDDLQDEITRLRKNDLSVDRMDQVLDLVAGLSKQIADNACKCECECGSTTTVKKTVKRVK